MQFMDELEDYEDYTEKDRTRGNRRKQDFTKAISKRRKDVSRGKAFANHPWYNNIHQYSKNKIHCSCLMCAFNGKINGRIVYKTRTISDMRKDLSLNQQLVEFKSAS